MTKKYIPSKVVVSILEDLFARLIWKLRYELMMNFTMKGVSKINKLLFQKVEGITYTFYSRVTVQLVLIGYIIFQTDKLFVQYLMGIIFIVLFLTNITLYNQKDMEHRFVRKLLIYELIAILLVFPFVSYSPYYIFFIILLITAILLLEKNLESVLFSLLFMMLPILHNLFLGELDWRKLMSYSLLVLFFSFFTHAIRRLQEQQEELQALNEQLEEYAKQDQELAVVKERVRIARDIHDTVAHKSTGLIIQLQKLQYIHRKNKMVETDELIYQLLNVARSMLEEMRQSVRSMAPSEKIQLSSLNVITRLIYDFQKSTSITINHHNLEILDQLSLDLKTLIYRILQESFTNAKRHGFASKIDVNCTLLAEDTLKISIKDNGRGLNEKQEHGFGLTNMEARLNEIGGSLIIQNHEPQGCIVTCLLPIKGVNIK